MALSQTIPIRKDASKPRLTNVPTTARSFPKAPSAKIIRKLVVGTESRKPATVQGSAETRAPDLPAFLGLKKPTPQPTVKPVGGEEPIAKWDLKPRPAMGPDRVVTGPGAPIKTTRNIPPPQPETIVPQPQGPPAPKNWSEYGDMIQEGAASLGAEMGQGAEGIGRSLAGETGADVGEWLGKRIGGALGGIGGALGGAFAKGEEMVGAPQGSVAKIVNQPAYLVEQAIGAYELMGMEPKERERMAEYERLRQQLVDMQRGGDSGSATYKALEQRVLAAEQAYKGQPGEIAGVRSQLIDPNDPLGLHRFRNMIEGTKEEWGRAWEAGRSGTYTGLNPGALSYEQMEAGADPEQTVLRNAMYQNLPKEIVGQVLLDPVDQIAALTTVPLGRRIVRSGAATSFRNAGKTLTNLLQANEIGDFGIGTWNGLTSSVRHGSTAFLAVAPQPELAMETVRASMMNPQRILDASGNTRFAAYINPFLDTADSIRAITLNDAAEVMQELFFDATSDAERATRMEQFINDPNAYARLYNRPIAQSLVGKRTAVVLEDIKNRGGLMTAMQEAAAKVPEDAPEFRRFEAMAEVVTGILSDVIKKLIPDHTTIYEQIAQPFLAIRNKPLIGGWSIDKVLAGAFLGSNPAATSRNMINNWVTMFVDGFSPFDKASDAEKFYSAIGVYPPSAHRGIGPIGNQSTQKGPFFIASRFSQARERTASLKIHHRAMQDAINTIYPDRVSLRLQELAPYLTSGQQRAMFSKVSAALSDEAMRAAVKDALSLPGGGVSFDQGLLAALRKLAPESAAKIDELSVGVSLPQELVRRIDTEFGPAIMEQRRKAGLLDDSVISQSDAASAQRQLIDTGTPSDLANWLTKRYYPVAVPAARAKAIALTLAERIMDPAQKRATRVVNRAEALQKGAWVEINPLFDAASATQRGTKEADRAWAIAFNAQTRYFTKMASELADLADVNITDGAMGEPVFVPRSEGRGRAVTATERPFARELEGVAAAYKTAFGLTDEQAVMLAAIHEADATDIAKVFGVDEARRYLSERLQISKSTRPEVEALARAQPLATQPELEGATTRWVPAEGADERVRQALKKEIEYIEESNNDEAWIAPGGEVTPVDYDHYATAGQLGYVGNRAIDARELMLNDGWIRYAGDGNFETGGLTREHAERIVDHLWNQIGDLDAGESWIRIDVTDARRNVHRGYRLTTGQLRDANYDLLAALRRDHPSDLAIQWQEGDLPTLRDSEGLVLSKRQRAALARELGDRDFQLDTLRSEMALEGKDTPLRRDLHQRLVQEYEARINLVRSHPILAETAINNPALVSLLEHPSAALSPRYLRVAQRVAQGKHTFENMSVRQAVAPFVLDAIPKRLHGINIWIVEDMPWEGQALIHNTPMEIAISSSSRKPLEPIIHELKHVLDAQNGLRIDTDYVRADGSIDMSIWRKTVSELRAREAELSVLKEGRFLTQPPQGTLGADLAALAREAVGEQAVVSDTLPDLREQYDVARTSVNIIPALLKEAPLERGTRNLDFGGGRYDTATNYLRDQRGVTNYVLDRFVRAPEDNAAVIAEMRRSPPDSVTVANVLNVISDPAVRHDAIVGAGRYAQAGTPIYFSVYEKVGARGTTRVGTWQEARKLSTYLDEIRSVYPDAVVNGDYIVAHTTADPAAQSGRRLASGRITEPRAGYLPGPNAERMVFALKNPDVTSAIHEAVHVRMDEWADIVKRSGVEDADFTVASEEVRKMGGVIDANGLWDRKAKEIIADAVEGLLFRGEAPKPAFARAVTRVAEWFRSIYRALKGTRFEQAISPELRRVLEAKFVEPLMGGLDPTTMRVRADAPNAVPTATTMSVVDETSALLDQIKASILSSNGQGAEIGGVPAPVLSKFLNDLSRDLSATKSFAMRVGTEARNFSLLDYTNRKAIDTLMASILIYPYWGSRTYPNWVKRILTRPSVLNNYFRYQRLVREQSKDMPEWLQDSIKIRVPGLPDSLHFNAMQWMNPLYNLIYDFSDPDRETTGLGRAIKAVDTAGFSVHPLLSYILAAERAISGKPDEAKAIMGYFAGPTRAFRYGTGVLGVNEGQGITLEPWLWEGKPFTGGDKWTMRRVTRILAQLEQEGLITHEAAAEAAHAASQDNWEHPLLKQAMAEEIDSRGWPTLFSFATGVPLRMYNATEAEMDQASNEWAELSQARDTMSYDTYSQLRNQFFQEHPYMSTLWLGRADKEKGDASWTWEVLNRLPPGQDKDILETVGIGNEILSAFKENKGFVDAEGEPVMNEFDRMKFLAGIMDLSTQYKVATPTMQDQWTEVKRRYSDFYRTADGKFPEWSTMQNQYYALKAESPESAKTFLAETPQLRQYWDWKAEYLRTDPLLQWFYGSTPREQAIDALWNYYQGLAKANRSQFYNILPTGFADKFFPGNYDAITDAELFNVSARLGIRLMRASSEEAPLAQSTAPRDIRVPSAVGIQQAIQQRRQGYTPQYTSER
jgi:hypothetical protein